MRKKLLYRGSALLLAALVAAVLVNPYSRQWLFGPKHAGVPLCAWQDHLRRQVVGDGKDGLLTSVLKWFRPKNPSLPTDKLSRDDKIAIWLSLLDDPVPAVRVRSIQSLWGGRQHHHWGGSWSYLVSGTSPAGSWDVTAQYKINFNASKYQLTSGTISVDGSALILYDDLLVFDGQTTPIQPPCDVAPHLIRMIDDPEAEVRAAVFVSLTGLHQKAEPAFPRLFELLSHADSRRRIQAATTLNQTHPKTRAWLDRLMALHEDADAEVRREVAGCLQSWHDRRMAVAAGPPLVKLLRDPEPMVRLQAASALESLRVHRLQAAETVRAALRHPQADMRRAAIGRLVEPADPAALFADLARCVRSDPDLAVQRAAAGVLNLTGKQAVPLLIALLQHPDKDMRQNAINTLANLGAEARAAVPFLIAGLDDDFAAIRIRALGSIGDAAAIPKLIELLDDNALCPHALSALAALGPKAQGTAPQLLKLAQSGSSEITEQAVRCLGDIGLAREELVTLLVPLLRDDASQAYRHAIELLAQIDPDHEAVLPALTHLAFEGPSNLRNHHFGLLRELGARARPLVPRLLRQLNENDDNLHTLCMQLLGAIGPDAAPAVPTLFRLTEAPEGNHRAYALEALGKIAAGPEKVVPLLIRLTRDENTVETAVDALGYFGPGAAAAVPDLLRLLKSERSTTRTAAAVALAKIVPRGEDLVSHLMPMARDDDDSVRTRIARLLGNLGPTAVPALCTLLDDDSQDVYETALAALAKIEP